MYNPSMSPRSRELALKLRQLKRLLARINKNLDELWIFPREGVYLDAIVLTLVSKSIALSRSTICLVENGFGEEAFATSRILLELALNLRYITNGRTPETRAKRFVHYVAKVKMEWGARAIEHFAWTQKSVREQSPFYKEFQALKRKYPKQSWLQANRKHSKGVWTMAMEPDRFDRVEIVDGKGKPVLNKRGKPRTKPFTWEFDYKIIYFWASQFVHVTIDSLDNHAAAPGKPFKVFNPQTDPPARRTNLSEMALFNTAITMHKILVATFRSLGQQYPEKLSKRVEACVKAFI